MRGGAERGGVAEQFRHLAEQVPGLRDLGVLVKVVQLLGRQQRGGREFDDLVQAGDLADRFELDGDGQAQQQVGQRAKGERRDLHGDVEAVAPYDRACRADRRDFPGQDPADEDEIHVLATRRGEIDRNADIELERLRPGDIPDRERREPQIRPGRAVVGRGEEPERTPASPRCRCRRSSRSIA